MADFKIDVVNPDVLVWARKAIRLSPEEAARKLGMTPLELQWLEEGGDNPTLRQLEKMADVYKRPLAVLFLPEPPRGFDAMRDFRLLPGNEGKPYSLALVNAFERIYMQREVAQELAELADERSSPLDLSISLDDDPERAGDRIRAWLNTLHHDLPRIDSKDDLNLWIELVEAKAILVTQVGGIEPTEMRGCSISNQPFPVILLNGADSRRARVFTLLHELTHILLQAGGVCDLEEPQRRRVTTRTDKEQIERFCNRVAAAVLMPKASVLRNLTDLTVARFVPVMRWTSEDLRRLAAMYGVSQEAMLVRLIHLDLASWDDYDDRRSQFRQRIGASRGYGNYYQMKLRNLGQRYVATVLDAYRNRDITGSELSDYLDIKVNRLPGLEAELEARR